MAVWQYDFILIPRDELISLAGILPTELSIDQVNRFKFWKVRQPKAVFADRFDSWSQEIKSWTPNLRLWGKEDSNRIDVAFSNEKIHEIEFRIEVRSINVRFLQLMVDFARTENCVLLSMHSFCVIEPLRERVLNYLTQSNGVNEVWDWLHDIPKVSKTSGPGCLFLSHTSIDKPFVSRLAVDLRAHNIPVWYDAWEIKVGDSLNKKIEQGINSSAWLAIALSKSSVASAWVEKELNAGLARELSQRSVFVLPLLLEDCEVPLFLRDKLYANFRDSYEAGFQALLTTVSQN